VHIVPRAALTSPAAWSGLAPYCAAVEAMTPDAGWPV
jgi:hypothetical protein